MKFNGLATLTKSLISDGQLDNYGYHTTFGNDSWKTHKGSMVLACGVKYGSLYPLYVSMVEDHVVNITKQPNTCFWHSRLGHMSQNGIKVLCCFDYMHVFNFLDFELCDFCVYYRHTKPVQKSLNQKKLAPLDLVHSDVCGPMPTRSLGGATYFVTFIDDATQKVWAYPIAHKDVVVELFPTHLSLCGRDDAGNGSTSLLLPSSPSPADTREKKSN